MFVVLLFLLHNTFLLTKEKNLCHVTKKSRIQIKKQKLRKLKHACRITFWIFGAQFPLAYCLAPCLQNMNNLAFPQPKKSKILCKQGNCSFLSIQKGLRGGGSKFPLWLDSSWTVRRFGFRAVMVTNLSLRSMELRLKRFAQEGMYLFRTPIIT